MITVLLLYLLLIFFLFSLLYFLLKHNKHYGVDRMYYDEEGNHIYYDRSLIQKIRFMRKHPNYESIRSIKRLFYFKHN